MYFIIYCYACVLLVFLCLLSQTNKEVSYLPLLPTDEQTCTTLYGAVRMMAMTMKQVEQTESLIKYYNCIMRMED